MSKAPDSNKKFRPTRTRPAEPRKPPAGQSARDLAVFLIDAVIRSGRVLDDAIANPAPWLGAAAMEPRDRALARMIVATALRRHGEIGAVIAPFLEKPLPEDRGGLSAILAAAAAQILFLATPAHAAINVAVEQCRRDRRARRFDKLANAVLRRVAEQGPEILARSVGARANIPDWLWQRWVAGYGEQTALRIAQASLVEAPLDITARADAAAWAERLGGRPLAGCTIRLAAGAGRIEQLAGFADGAWWVQDAAASLPVRLLGDVRGQLVADLCAAPGGKSAQLAAAGASVVAVEASHARTGRLRQNLERLKLSAEIVEADAAEWAPGRQFDAVIADAPCTATGTIRRHPDILHLKRPEDIARLAGIQARILANAMRLVKPGGLVIYCTCSMEMEECEDQVARLLGERSDLQRVPIRAEELGIEAGAVNSQGDLRTLPFHAASESEGGAGMDGFFAARLRRLA